MCCDRLQTCAMDFAASLPNSDPNRERAVQIVWKFHGQCSIESHSKGMAGIKRTESEVVARLVRNNSEDIDFLNENGALAPLLRNPSEALPQ